MLKNKRKRMNAHMNAHHAQMHAIPYPLVIYLEKNKLIHLVKDSLAIFMPTLKNVGITLKKKQSNIVKMKEKNVIMKQVKKKNVMMKKMKNFSEKMMKTQVQTARKNKMAMTPDM